MTKPRHGRKQPNSSASLVYCRPPGGVVVQFSSPMLSMILCVVVIVVVVIHVVVAVVTIGDGCMVDLGGPMIKRAALGVKDHPENSRNLIIWPPSD